MNPNNPEVLIYYANLYSNLGRHEEALTMAKRARELDPLNLRTNALEAQFMIDAGQNDEALERLQKTLTSIRIIGSPTFSPSAFISKREYMRKPSNRVGGRVEFTIAPVPIRFSATRWRNRGANRKPGSSLKNF